MSNSKYSWGYCPSCMKNVPHFRRTSYVARTLERLSAGLLTYFRFGPWYCAHCQSKTVFLRAENLEAPQASAENFQIESSNPKLAPETAPAATSSEPIGNFIKMDQSLVSRSTRLKRFSEKFRDSIVRRLMTGKLTFSQVREEQNVTEGELVDWIADLFERMQSKIDATESFRSAFDSISLQNIDGQAIEHEGTYVFDPDSTSTTHGITIEGQAKPK